MKYFKSPNPECNCTWDELEILTGTCDGCEFKLPKFPEQVAEYERTYGHCPNCGEELSNWGAASDGDGDIYDQIGCDSCEELIEKRHADYCTCQICKG